MVRGSTTSTSIPSTASRSATASERCTISEVATTVTSPPRRLISACPKGMAAASSGTGPLISNSSTWSMKTVGLLLLTAVLSESFDIARRRGKNDFQSRTIPQHRLRTVRVLRPARPPDAVQQMENDRDRRLPARHVKRIGRFVDDLRPGLVGEAGGDEIDHRPQTGHGGAGGQSAKAEFGNRRGNHPVGKVLSDRPEAGAMLAQAQEASQDFGDVMHALIGRDDFTQCFQFCFVVSDLSHGVPPRAGRRSVRQKRPSWPLWGRDRGSPMQI